MFQQLKNQFKNTQINFQRIDNVNMQTDDIQKMIQNILLKLQTIDVFINAMETCVDKDLQRTLDINAKHYLNFLQLVRNVMDKNKGGRGGIIVNVLSNLGLQTLENNDVENNFQVQQYLINKQMLMSVTKAFSGDTFFQQTGVSVITIMPVVNQKVITKNVDWIKKIGLQNLLVDINMVRGQNNQGQGNYLGQDTVQGLNTGNQDFNLGCFDNDNTNQFGNNNVLDFNQDIQNVGNTLGNHNVYNQGNCNNLLGCGQNFGGVTGNLRKLLDVLSMNIVRVIERGQNGVHTVVGLGGVKDIQQTGNFSHL